MNRITMCGQLLRAKSKGLLLALLAVHMPLTQATIQGAEEHAQQVTSHKTARMALPSKTNNAWELKPVKLADLSGQERELYEWSGKVIMLNFWASWCGPCQIEIPQLVSYQEKYGDEGLQVVGIGLDQKRKLKNVARSLDINYPVLVIDEFNGVSLMREWGNETGIIPYTVIIDRDGRIRYIHRGQMDDYVFDHQVKPLLKAKK